MEVWGDDGELTISSTDGHTLSAALLAAAEHNLCRSRQAESSHAATRATDEADQLVRLARRFAPRGVAHDRRLAPARIGDIRSDAPAGAVRTGRVAGYAAVFYSPSDPGTEYKLEPGFVERIDYGAFVRTLREDDQRALWNHEWDQVLGRRSARTLGLDTDPVGLRYQIALPDSPLGMNADASICRGDVRQSSFGFLVRREVLKREGALRVRVLMDVKLLEVSPVTFPAYESTTVAPVTK